MAERLFLAGFNEREIAESMGWSEETVKALINRYVKTDELLRDRIHRLDQHAARTKNANPSANPAG